MVVLPRAFKVTKKVFVWLLSLNASLLRLNHLHWCELQKYWTPSHAHFKNLWWAASCSLISNRFPAGWCWLTVFKKTTKKYYRFIVNPLCKTNFSIKFLWREFQHTLCAWSPIYSQRPVPHFPHFKSTFTLIKHSWQIKRRLSWLCARIQMNEDLKHSLLSSCESEKEGQKRLICLPEKKNIDVFSSGPQQKTSLSSEKDVCSSSVGCLLCGIQEGRFQRYIYECHSLCFK